MIEFDYWYEVSKRNGNRAVEYAGMLGQYKSLLSSALRKLKYSKDDAATTDEYIVFVEKMQDEIENHFNELVGNHKKEETSLT